MNETKKKGY